MSEQGDPAGTATSLVELIDGLVEPAEPAAIAMTPQTWGWIALAVLILALTGWAFVRWRMRLRANAYRREALARLEQARTVSEVAKILRRAALAAYPRAEVAGLTGEDWLAFLSRTGNAAPPPDVGAELLRAPYRSETAPPSADVMKWTAAWLRSHEVWSVGVSGGAPPREEGAV